MNELEDYTIYDYDEEPDAWAVCDLTGSPIAGPYPSIEEAEEAAKQSFEPGRYVISPLYL